jgi:predicted nucleic acid-binding protein
MSALLDAYAGKTIYLDTMLPYDLLRGIDPVVKPFFQRIEQGELTAYTSVLTFDELAYRLVLALIKDRYGGSPLDQLRADEARLMTEFAPSVSALLDQFRLLPHLTVLNVLADDVALMNAGMLHYQLRPRDALHWAAMQRIGCLDLASNDPHFDRIPAVRRYAAY